MTISKTFDGMTDDEFQTALSALVKDAENFSDETLAPERIVAQKLYDTEDYGNELPGRSKVHSSDVKDAIMSKVPSFVRTLCSGKIVSVIPRTEREVNQALDQSDTVDFLWSVKNDGFRITYDAIHDAELKKIGVIHWYPETRTRVIPATYRDFTAEMIDILTAEDDVELISKEEQEADETPTTEQADPHHSALDPTMMRAATSEPGYDAESAEQGEPLYTIQVARTVKDVQFNVVALPPEEFIANRAAKSECEAQLLGRRRELTIAELVSLGYDRDEIEEHAGSATPDYANFEQERLQRVHSLNNAVAESSDPSLRKVLYYELWHRVNKDGVTGYPWYKTCCIGSAHHVLYSELAEEQDFPPFAVLSSSPVPHTIWGQSVVDSIGELQLIKTQILRNTMDSLANAIFPKTAFDVNSVNIDDMMSSEIGSLVRVRGQPGASIQELNSTFIGPQSMAVLSYIDDTKQKRLGVGDGTSLKGDELQSTTAVAAAAIVGQGADRLEMEARHYAEGLKKVFRGLLRMVIRHADKPLPITTRDGTQRFIDPRGWDPDADLAICVALGKNSEQNRIALLQQVLQVQTQLIQSAGLQQPLVTPQEVRNTLEDLCNAMGAPQVSRWFRQVPPGWAPSPPNKQLDPVWLQAQATAMQAQVQQRKAEGDHLIALEKTRNDATHAAAKLAQDRELAILEIQAKYGVQVNQALVEQGIEHERLQRDHEVASALGMAELDHKAQQADLDRQNTMMMQSLNAQPGQDGPQGAPGAPSAPRPAGPAQPAPQAPQPPQTPQ